MEPFVKFTGVVATLDRTNIDTDAIIPKQFLKRIEKTGFGQFLFFEFRFYEEGEPIKDFILNQPRYKNASILLARANFGCGSSREHPAVGLAYAGVKAVICKSVNRIFYRSAVNHGLPIILLPAAVDEYLQGDIVDVDFEAGKVLISGKSFSFSPLPDKLVGIFKAKGLVNFVKASS